MALSLGWHIVLACFGVAFPMLIWVVHRRGIRDDDPVALGLAKRWSKVAAVLFAVGAVSGTILSFEMGLLWPELMRTYGDVIGLPFAFEGIAFFLEAIFIGIYLYGWDRLPPRVHLLTLVPIAVSGVVGTFCIISVNAWMNTPTGFRLVDGEVTDVDPWAAMFNPGVWVQFAHMWVATVMVVGFCTAAVYATGLLRGAGRPPPPPRVPRRVRVRRGRRRSSSRSSGHLAGARLADAQPTKLAAMELAPETEQPAPLVHRRRADRRRASVRHRDPEAGLADRPGAASTGRCRASTSSPTEDRPKDELVTMVHLTFQAMVGARAVAGGAGRRLLVGQPARPRPAARRAGSCGWRCWRGRPRSPPSSWAG